MDETLTERVRDKFERTLMRVEDYFDNLGLFGKCVLLSNAVFILIVLTPPFSIVVLVVTIVFFIYCNRWNLIYYWVDGIRETLLRLELWWRVSVDYRRIRHWLYPCEWKWNNMQGVQTATLPVKIFAAAVWDCTRHPGWLVGFTWRFACWLFRQAISHPPLAWIMELTQFWVAWSMAVADTVMALTALVTRQYCALMISCVLWLLTTEEMIVSMEVRAFWMLAELAWMLFWFFHGWWIMSLWMAVARVFRQYVRIIGLFVHFYLAVINVILVNPVDWLLNILLLDNLQRLLYILRGGKM